jgi:hypothetical protein
MPFPQVLDPMTQPLTSGLGAGPNRPYVLDPRVQPLIEETPVPPPVPVVGGGVAVPPICPKGWHWSWRLRICVPDDLTDEMIESNPEVIKKALAVLNVGDASLQLIEAIEQPDGYRKVAFRFLLAIDKK